MSKPSNGFILQVAGLGVPVQAPTDRNQSGFEIRWSSDPEIPANCPAHVLIGDHATRRFLTLSVDKAFHKSDVIRVIPVEVEDGKTYLSKEACTKLGVNPDNWDLVRVGVVVAGNTGIGPVMDVIDWIGSREEFNCGDHLRHGLSHGASRGMVEPSIFPHTEGGHVLRAAEFIAGVRKQMKPSLRTAEMIMAGLEEALINLDMSKVTPEKAIHYLIEVQNALVSRREHQQFELDDLGTSKLTQMKQAQDDTDRLAEESPHAAPAPAFRSPRLH